MTQDAVSQQPHSPSEACMGRRLAMQLPRNKHGLARNVLYDCWKFLVATHKILKMHAVIHQPAAKSTASGKVRENSKVYVRLK